MIVYESGVSMIVNVLCVCALIRLTGSATVLVVVETRVFSAIQYTMIPQFRFTVIKAAVIFHLSIYFHLRKECFPTTKKQFSMCIKTQSIIQYAWEPASSRHAHTDSKMRTRGRQLWETQWETEGNGEGAGGTLAFFTMVFTEQLGQLAGSWRGQATSK